MSVFEYVLFCWETSFWNVIIMTSKLKDSVSLGSNKWELANQNTAYKIIALEWVILSSKISKSKLKMVNEIPIRSSLNLYDLFSSKWDK